MHGVFGLLVTDMEPFAADPSTRADAGVDRSDFKACSTLSIIEVMKLD